MKKALETKRQTEILIGKLITKRNRVVDPELQQKYQGDIDLFINGNRKIKALALKGDL